MLNRAFGKLLAVMNSVASLGIAGLMVLICADVVSRAMFNRPLPGVPEIARFSVVVMLWLQMPYTLRAGRHLRSGLLLDRVTASGRGIIEIVNGLLGAAIFSMIAIFAVPQLITVFRGGDFEGAAPVRIPLWPVWSIFIFGASLTAIQYLINMVRAFRGRASSGANASSDDAEIEGG